MGYFFFSSSTMNSVYAHGGVDTQISGAYPVYEYLRVYGSLEFVRRGGYSLGGHQKTFFWEIPLSVGLQPTFQIYKKTPVYYYFTLGPRYTFAHASNNSAYVSHAMNANGIGGFVNTGFQIRPIEHFLLDLFGEYSYNRLKFTSHVPNSHGNTVQVGGFTFGVGLGYAF